MFRDISQLSNDELDHIVEKFGTVLKSLNPNEVPPLVYQALLLTNENGPFAGKLIGHLSSYYNQEIREEQDSEDMIGSNNTITQTALRRSESIVMVHINSKASGHPILKEVQKMLKSGIHVPDLIFNPFTLQLCLSLTSLKQHRAGLVDGLKGNKVLQKLRETNCATENENLPFLIISGVIQKTVLSIKKKKESIWFCEEIGEIHHPLKLLSKVIENTCQYGSWALIGDGVVDLAFALLDVNAGLATGRVDEKLKTGWLIGENILKEVVKHKLDVAESIIKQLSKRIMFSKAAPKVFIYLLVFCI